MKTQEQKALEILNGLANFLGYKDLPSRDSGITTPGDRSVTITDDWGFGESVIHVGEHPDTRAHFGVRIPKESDEQVFARWVDQMHNLVCGSDYLLQSQHFAEEIAFEAQARKLVKSGVGV